MKVRSVIAMASHHLSRLVAIAAAAVALAVGGLVLAGCTPKTQGAEQPLAIVARTVDDHSYARPLEAAVTHVDLDLTADFKKKVLRGTAALTLVTQANAKQVILDVRALNILSVTDAAGAPLKYAIGHDDPMMGAPLTIQLPQGAQKVVVSYETTKGGTALQWLDPSQTAGKRLPFLFSQGEEIHTRTWIPTQDSPAIRQTYTARITVPSDLMAVMSADKLTPDGEPVAGHPEQHAYRFNMSHPIAPYLIAIAVGDLGFKSEGSKTGVYAEKAVLDKAAAEFTDMQSMLDAAEKLYGTYPWGRYDVLVLPPSFPYGGMENPTLTFATPTILAGDKSLVSLIAHELAHSWSGNLVTNATWEDFWLNEGFTNYFESRIMEQVYGKEDADMLKVLNYNDLQETLTSLKDNPEFTKLHPDLKGISPDDYFSDIPYEKGASFLRMLENHFGRKKFDGWLKGYFKRYAFHSMTTEAFLVDLRQNLLRNDTELEKQLKIQDWLYGPGLPSNVIVPSSPVFAAVDEQIKAFVDGADPKSLATADYNTQQWQYFLTHLPEDLSTDQLEALDGAFNFSHTHNSEILFDWLTIGIKHHYLPAMPALHDFLVGQGRMKFCTPLYRQLAQQPGWGGDMARRIYAEARPGYHELTRQRVDAVLK